MIKGISIIASIILHATIIVAVCGIATREPNKTDAEMGAEPIALEFVEVTLEPAKRSTNTDIATNNHEAEIAKEEAKDSAEEVAKVEEVDAEPIAIIKPKYPRHARRRGIEGDVRVKVFIASDTSISDVAIESSSGSLELDEAALEAARGTKFNPASRAGLPIDGEAVLTFNFRLH